jgi:hypothetical protein
MVGWRVRLLPLLLLVACQPEKPPLSSCADSLTGVWDARADPRPPGAPPGGIAFDVRDRGATIEVYPLWDTSVPASGAKPGWQGEPGLVLAPWKISLERAGAAVAGELEQRFTQQGKICSARSAVRLSACRASRARLDVEVITQVDPVSCAPEGEPLGVIFELKRR